MTAKLYRFLDPKAEKMFSATAEAGKLAIYAGVANNQGQASCTDLTISITRTVYEIFYSMADHLPPSTICEQIDYFIEMMTINLPFVKKNVWQWSNKEEPHE